MVRSLKAEKLRQEEKERARLNETLQLLHIKYASRENVFKEKVIRLNSDLHKVRVFFCFCFWLNPRTGGRTAQRS